MWFDQTNYRVRCEWGLHGVRTLAPISDVVIIVDALSFSTCVEIAVARGATVFPCRWKGDDARRLAEDKQGVLAAERSVDRLSLSPQSLLQIEPGTRLVLPSPNGSTLTLESEKPTIAGCLRNARAVASYAQEHAGSIAVIPAGERWPDGSLRPAFEDLVAAGAILSYLDGERSPECEQAVAAYHACAEDLESKFLACSSGQELVERGYTGDVRLASVLNCSDAVPIVKEGAYVRA